jgi:hypothetical protein
MNLAQFPELSKYVYNRVNLPKFRDIFYPSEQLYFEEEDEEGVMKKILNPYLHQKWNVFKSNAVLFFAGLTPEQTRALLDAFEKNI